MLRKIDAMHARYGRCPGVCRDCEHLFRCEYSRHYYKCELYGDSRSEATDWRMSYPACGMLNKPLPERFTPIVRFVAMEAHTKKSEAPIDGQVEMGLG